MGHTDVPLDRVGISQAERLPEILSSRQPTAIYTSPLSRARMTAEIIGDHLDIGIRRDDRLCEVNMGELTGLNWTEVEQRFPSFARAREADPARTRRPGGESDQDLQDRSVAAFDDIIKTCPGKVVVVVTHGGTLKALLAHLLSMPLGDKWRLRVDNGSLSVLRQTHRGWELELLNYTAHLQGVNPVPPVD